MDRSRCARGARREPRGSRTRSQAPMVQLEPVIDLNTFSIVARDGEAGALGVAVATARPTGGSLVPRGSPRGAVATQARGNTELGRQGMLLVDQGGPIDVALGPLLWEDSARDIP